jgi:chromosomal replication initiation ATPase DnaA
MLVTLLLEKLFAQRGLLLPPDVATTIATRVERSYVGLMRLVDALDNAALSQRKAITPRLAKKVLEQIGMGEADLFGR